MGLPPCHGIKVSPSGHLPSTCLSLMAYYYFTLKHMSAIYTLTFCRMLTVSHHTHAA